MRSLEKASDLLIQEANGLLARLARVKPFGLIMPMTTAAMPSKPALQAIEQYLVQGRQRLYAQVQHYIRWLKSPASRQVPPHELQRRLAFLKLLFNRVLSQLDLFADVLTQRSELENGSWLAGLDVVAADALDLRGSYYEPPPLVCYLDRGHGAAIRRVRTRLPGGGKNPVAIIRVPRERMVGSGIGASLIHEVGHQGSVLLGLIESMRAELDTFKARNPELQEVWSLWGRWISEIIADFWAITHLGVGSTLGLMGVVSLPRPFVFRISLDDPHPIPWIRVRLSVALGQALYPDPQWERVKSIWNRLYPLSHERPEKQQLFRKILSTIPDFARVLINHRPRSLHGRSLREVFPVDRRQPDALRALYHAWNLNPIRMRRQPPTLVFAAIGQAKADGRMLPELEVQILAELLDYWALRDTLSPRFKMQRISSPAYALYT